MHIAHPPLLVLYHSDRSAASALAARVMALRAALRRFAAAAALAALATLLALPSADAFACIACPPGYFHVGCDFLTNSAGARPTRARRLLRSLSRLRACTSLALRAAR